MFSFLFRKKTKFECENCCDKSASYCFYYDRMVNLQRNPNLKYRDNGDIDFDPFSRLPNFVEYNNAREVIRQAKKAGQNHVHWRMSVAVAKEIRQDGYIDHNDKLDTISW